MATRHTKTVCVIALPVTYKVSVRQFTVGAQQPRCLQGMLDGWHWRDRLPLHSLSEASASRMCQTRLTVKVTRARALHAYTDGCSTSRLITSTGCAPHSTFTLVFIWDFLIRNFRHVCRTGSSVRKKGKKTPSRGAPARLMKDGVNCYGGQGSREMMSSLTRPWLQSWHRHPETKMRCSQKHMNNSLGEGELLVLLALLVYQHKIQKSEHVLNPNDIFGFPDLL